MTIDPEEYEAWKESPITQWFFTALKEYAKNRHELWDTMSWGGGNANEKALYELRGQAFVAEHFADASYDTVAANFVEQE